MTALIIEEWLCWFDLRMTGRKVALLMDNFSAHEKAVQEINMSSQPLQNTLIIWLPANTTSKYQPLDQGIINTWKTLWRQQWVRYMLQEYEAGRDPVTTMDILKAIRWGIQVWDLDLSAQTIINCFHKGLYAKSAPDDTALVYSDIYNNVQRLQSMNAIQDAMDIQQFLNPSDEEITDDPNSIENRVLAQFQEPQGADVEEEDIDHEIDVQTPITSHNALTSLRTLRLYLEQQEEGDTALIWLLNRLENNIQRQEIQNRRQVDIRGYFGGQS